MKKLLFYFTFFPCLIFCFSNISQNLEDNEKKIETYVNFLFWKTFEEGLDYIYTNRISSPASYGIIGDIKSATY